MDPGSAAHHAASAARCAASGERGQRCLDEANRSDIRGYCIGQRSLISLALMRATILARLAVHSNAQGRGIGAGLLLDALGRTLHVADVIGVRALAVHAKDDRAVAFYQHFGFAPSPVDPRHLFMIIKDIRLAAELKP